MIPALLVMLFACGDPNAPRHLAWDHEVCGGCGMTVSDRAFAVQLVETDGRVHFYDDPVCAFRSIAQDPPHIAHLWFRDSTDDGWISWREARFVPTTGAPMDGGLAAVPFGTPASISFEEASGRALSRGGH